jgi:hypothetical protein
MRMWSELNEKEQEQAIGQETDDILAYILENPSIGYPDELNRDSLEAAIRAAMDKADDMQTPWFAGEYVMEATYSWDPGDGNTVSVPVSDAIRGMAWESAEDAWYPDPDDQIIRLGASVHGNE